MVRTQIYLTERRGYRKAVAFVNAKAFPIILSSIVVAVLFTGVRGKLEQTAMERYII